MIPLLHQYIESLRDEMKQYGELLALLDEPQSPGSVSVAEEVLGNLATWRAQESSIDKARRHRLGCQRQLAHALGRSTDAPLAQLVVLLPVKYRPLVTALAQENEQLRQRVQQRVSQNHRQLGRALECLRRSLQTLIPACADGKGVSESMALAD